MDLVDDFRDYPPPREDYVDGSISANKPALFTSSTRRSKLGRRKDLGVPQRLFFGEKKDDSFDNQGSLNKDCDTASKINGNYESIKEEEEEFSDHSWRLSECEWKKNEGIALKKLMPRGMDNTSLIVVNGSTYRLLKMIGRGGSSEVFDAFDSDGHLRAIKIVQLDKNQANLQKGYLNEVSLLQSLQKYERVIKLYNYEYNKKEEKLFVVMERGDTSLASVLTKPLSLTKIKFYWEEILNVVKVIHDAGVIHSDLKPANFIIVSGMLKIIDFGIASLVKSDHTSVIKDNQEGTFNFMAPEAIQGVNEDNENLKIKISYKTDVWSLGCILFLLSFGKTPFSDIKNPWKKCLAITDPNHKVLIPPGAHTNSPIKEIILSCLNRDPYKRPSIDYLLNHLFLKNSDSNQIDHIISIIEEACSPKTRLGFKRARSQMTCRLNNPS